MVEDSPSGPSTVDKPFALRSAVYTVGFLLLVLGAVPSVLFLIERLLLGGEGAAASIRAYWVGLRQLLGIAVFSIGLAGYLFCSIWLMFFGRGPHVEFDPPTHFVATGPYRYVRNPVVITLLATVLGEAIYLGSIGVFALVLIGLPVAHLQVTRIEEPNLRRRFGESYDAYCRSVPRWLPRPPLGPHDTASVA